MIKLKPRKMKSTQSDFITLFMTTEKEIERIESLLNNGYRIVSLGALDSVSLEKQIKP